MSEFDFEKPDQSSSDEYRRLYEHAMELRSWFRFVYPVLKEVHWVMEMNADHQKEKIKPCDYHYRTYDYLKRSIDRAFELGWIVRAWGEG